MTWEERAREALSPLAIRRYLDKTLDAIRPIVEEEIGQRDELIQALNGREVEVAITRQVQAVNEAAKKANVPEVITNLTGALASVAAMAVTYGRWAALEHQAHAGDEKVPCPVKSEQEWKQRAEQAEAHIVALITVVGHFEDSLTDGERRVLTAARRRKAERGD